MKKKIMCKPATELELEFSGGDKLYMKFDVKALMHLSEVMNVNDIKTSENIPEICANIVYASSCEYADDMAQDRARFIVSNMDIGTITAIIQEFSESVGVIGDELKEINSKNVMNQFQSKKMKN
ncbi:hypothetical protein SAMN02746066_04563 [Anaerosporobacter mobilis DSM 15930]|jgi:hypothetical protein|uniref:Phage tail assembly chaperone protein, TAC n=1 Tax=Anaerosporobacter mobilis DSM 15930 TaxID=1120996 RepID=A0A1M7NLG3_9FIRM|nr:hypothetical protein [Anaerosporobacter mobilis]SHN04172.1 hypothetical protein SAMN02746066_04563 [Anaerosporobacter mobilis DSM 15930]